MANGIFIGLIIGLVVGAGGVFAYIQLSARNALAKARAEAKRIVEEANRKRGEIEKVIDDLERRREGVVAELRRLASDVAGAAGAPPPDKPAPPAPAASDRANGAHGAEEPVNTAQ